MPFSINVSVIVPIPFFIPPPPIPSLEVVSLLYTKLNNLIMNQLAMFSKILLVSILIG